MPCQMQVLPSQVPQPTLRSVKSVGEYDPASPRKNWQNLSIEIQYDNYKKGTQVFVINICLHLDSTKNLPIQYVWLKMRMNIVKKVPI